MLLVVFAAHKLCWVCCGHGRMLPPSLYPGPGGAAYKLIYGHLCSQLSDSQPWPR